MLWYCIYIQGAEKQRTPSRLDCCAIKPDSSNEISYWKKKFFWSWVDRMERHKEFWFRERTDELVHKYLWFYATWIMELNQLCKVLLSGRLEIMVLWCEHLWKIDGRDRTFFLKGRVRCISFRNSLKFHHFNGVNRHKIAVGSAMKLPIHIRNDACLTFFQSLRLFWFDLSRLADCFDSLLGYPFPHP